MESNAILYFENNEVITYSITNKNQEQPSKDFSLSQNKTWVANKQNLDNLSLLVELLVDLDQGLTI